jgi:hypothetical protein
MTNDHENQPLSEAGAARRDAMLGELTGFMDRRHRAKQIRRRTVTTAGVAGLLLVTVTLIVRTPGAPVAPEQIDPPGDIAQGHVDDTPVPPPIDPMPVTDDAPAPVAPVPQGPTIAYVKSDPAQIESMIIRTAEASRVQRLTDEEFLQAMAEIGRPTGLIRMEGRVWTSEDVTDPLPPLYEPPVGDDANDVLPHEPPRERTTTSRATAVGSIG